jgi:signal transduction histidine kinase
MARTRWDRRRLAGRARTFAASALLLTAACAAAESDGGRLVVVLYPASSDGTPGQRLVDRAIRDTFAAGTAERVEIVNEYIDYAPAVDGERARFQVEYLRRKHAGRKIDLVIAGLSSALDFAVRERPTAFPGVPIVHYAVDAGELKSRRLPADVVGRPVAFDLTGTLDLALRMHPGTRRVYVIAGAAPFDAYWEGQARQAFRSYEGPLEFVYWSGLPLDQMLAQVGQLPPRSIIYYLHVGQDDAGRGYVPAEVLELLGSRANAPIYGHVDTYVGRGAVGGHVFSFYSAGADAARTGLRLLAGERPEAIGEQEPSPNVYMFDWPQLRRWGINESHLPTGSEVRNREFSFFYLYKWQIIAAASLCVVQAMVIAGLLIQRFHRRQAESRLRDSQHELRELTGRLLLAQETERRRIARELHDDLNQNLALLSVELDLLRQSPPGAAAELGRRLQELTGRVKQLCSGVHDLSHQLHPSKLEQLGLVAALGSLCKELTRTHGLPIEFRHRGVPGVLTDDVALSLYRVAQEALGNAIKHSGAGRAEVELAGAPGEVRMRVSDDGSGFDPAAAGQEGLGLVSMRERLRFVGGEIAFGAGPSGGTRVYVRIPLPPTLPREEVPELANTNGRHPAPSVPT